jgi:TorA maturation chaperone TorD
MEPASDQFNLKALSLQGLGMETKNLLNHESSRMATFRWLSICYFVPDTGMPDTLDDLQGHLANTSASAAKCVRRMRQEIENDRNCEALKVDFARLFVGPYKLLAAPYGSVYLDSGRTMMGDSTLDVKNRYREAGLNTATNFKEAPDHITAELEFMYYLIFKEIEAFSNSDIETAIGCIQKQRSFLEDHLMRWVPQFAGNIREHAETAFYQNLAKATETVLKESCTFVCSVLDSVSMQLGSEKQIEINSLRV